MRRLLINSAFLSFVVLIGVHSVYGQTNDELCQLSDVAFNAAQSGNVDSISDLQKALADPRLNTQARTALEALPNGAGLASLRAGLNLSNPICVAGCLNSLGNLRDLESIAQVLKLAQNQENPDVVRCAALQSLGRFATPEATRALLAELKSENQLIRKASADALFYSGSELEDPALFQAVREASIDAPTTAIAVLNEILLSNDVDLFANLLNSENRDDFRAACAVISQTESQSIIEAAIAVLPNTPFEKRERVIRALGNSDSPSVTTGLLKLLNASSTDDALTLVLIQTVGELKQPSSFDSLFKFLSSDDETLRNAAVDAICRLDAFSEENVSQIERSLDSKKPLSQELAQACLIIITRKNITSAIPKVENIALTSSEPQIASQAVLTYAKIVQPSPELVETFLERFSKNNAISFNELELSLEAICRRSDDKEGTISSLEKVFANQPARLARYVGVIGGKYSADYLGNLALQHIGDSSEEGIATIDEATQSLGRWGTADASESLARLACFLPEERLGKFKTRAIRGYLRIVRQMGEKPLEKLRKISLAQRMTVNRPQEKELLGSLDERFAQKFKERSLFNGIDLSGWEEYEKGTFVVEDGAIVGGNFETGIEHNQFLTTVDSFSDFYLRLECKVVVGDNNQSNDGNAGIQFRSVRIPDNWEMIGYQADMSTDGGYWGCLYDESRRNRMLQTPDPVLQKALLKPNDWNTYEILAQGKNIQIFLNGIQTVDYVEEENNLPQVGKIGLQIHAGNSARAYYRNIFICDATTDDSN